MKLIECDNLSMRYEGETVVNQISFCVEEGEFVAIVGENGSGKSTLVKGILGLKSPCGGNLSFHGIARTQIGYLPQQTLTQRDFPATVEEVVRSGCLNRMGLRPFFNKEEKKRADEVMRELRITDIRKKCYRDLSGGQQQRVLLARALCATEKLLLLDEPVSGLDPIVTAEMYSMINHLNKDNGVTVIMISHDIPSAIRYADKILHVAENSFFGTVEEYMHTDRYMNMGTS